MRFSLSAHNFRYSTCIDIGAGDYVSWWNRSEFNVRPPSSSAAVMIASSGSDADSHTTYSKEMSHSAAFASARTAQGVMIMKPGDDPTDWSIQLLNSHA